MEINSEKGPLYISRNEVIRCLSGEWSNLIKNVEVALERFSAGKEGGIIQPVRSAVPIEDHEGLLLTMPAYSAQDGALASKLVTVYPQNKKVGLPSVQATVLLYNSQTGSLQAVMDGNVITTMRTAAASAVATKYLARKDSQVLSILGAGNQARSHFQALNHLFNFKKVTVWNVRKESALKFVAEIEESGVSAVYCDTVEEAVRNADIIVTVTMSTTPVLKAEWVKPGAHINAVGAPVPTWQELSSQLMQSATVYVDSREAALAESGDIIISKADVYAEIGEVVSGKKKALPNETTVFKSLGMAVEDVVAAKMVFEIYSTSH